MNKILKVGSYGSAIGIVGILAKPIITGGISSATVGFGAVLKTCAAFGSFAGVSGGAVLGLVVLSSVAMCVDIKSLPCPDVLGFIAKGLTGDNGEEDRVANGLKSIKVKED